MAGDHRQKSRYVARAVLYQRVDYWQISDKVKFVYKTTEDGKRLDGNDDIGVRAGYETALHKLPADTDSLPRDKDGQRQQRQRDEYKDHAGADSGGDIAVPFMKKPLMQKGEDRVGEIGEEDRPHERHCQRLDDIP